MVETGFAIEKNNRSPKHRANDSKTFQSRSKASMRQTKPGNSTPACCAVLVYQYTPSSRRISDKKQNALVHVDPKQVDRPTSVVFAKQPIISVVAICERLE
jgi:hypothetical protein